MSDVAVRAALESRLNAMSPALDTAYENLSYTPVIGTPYQRINLVRAEPQNPTRDSFKRLLGFMQVTLMYPQGDGPGKAEARAELIRAQFPRGLQILQGIPSVTPSDLYYNRVAALLHMDGADASTVFTDAKGHVFTRAQGGGSGTSLPRISTARSKFGGASALWPNNTWGDERIQCVHNDFVVGTQDFCSEGWIYKPEAGNTANGSLFALGATASPAGGMYCAFSEGSYAIKFGAAAELTGAIPNWVYDSFGFHALTRESGLVRFFFNGVLITQFTAWDDLTSNQLNIGGVPVSAYGLGVQTNANLDEFRFTIGQARYTSGFTVPAAAFPEVQQGSLVVTVNGTPEILPGFEDEDRWSVPVRIPYYSNIS